MGHHALIAILDEDQQNGPKCLTHFGSSHSGSSHFGSSSAGIEVFACAFWAVVAYGGHKGCASQLDPATSEQSWHRRARRQRQAARGILALARANRVLANHHGGGMAPSKGSNVITGKDDSMAVLPGRKTPHWCCSCGADGNWASRLRCGCSKAAPARIRLSAEKAAKEFAAPLKLAQPQQPQSAWARGGLGHELAAVQAHGQDHFCWSCRRAPQHLAPC